MPKTQKLYLSADKCTIDILLNGSDLKTFPDKIRL